MRESGYWSGVLKGRLSRRRALAASGASAWERRCSSPAAAATVVAAVPRINRASWTASPIRPGRPSAAAR
jgi:hypothetical protein